MEIRNAILMAADHIEQNPEQYSFESCVKPECGTPGCMIGWIGVYANFTNDYGSYMSRFREEFGFDYVDIGKILDGKHTVYGHDRWCYLMSYQRNANAAAEVMRMFADQRFPAKSFSAPDWTAMSAKRTILPDAVDEMVRA